jgi:hypothetical protein
MHKDSLLVSPDQRVLEACKSPFVEHDRQYDSQQESRYIAEH